ncbi:hypothetical protein Leryth_006838 [Lithospermum erythrorhizon]|nr:hypothetical protein Leryth_006838 [Lithospermum erythrorhizon]
MSFTPYILNSILCNALFSYFLNSQNFTPYILNSIVLLTISSILLVTSASYSLVAFLNIACVSEKVIKNKSFKVILDMVFYENLVATGCHLDWIFFSGEWRLQVGKCRLCDDIECVDRISWQAFSVGCIGLIFKVSALFSNVIGMLSLPVAPVAAVIIFHDKMDGVKVISMVLAVWGFASYIYQHYLDDKIKTEEKKITNDISLVEEIH